MKAVNVGNTPLRANSALPQIRKKQWGDLGKEETKKQLGHLREDGLKQFERGRATVVQDHRDGKKTKNRHRREQEMGRGMSRLYYGNRPKEKRTEAGEIDFEQSGAGWRPIGRKVKGYPR